MSGAGWLAGWLVGWLVIPQSATVKYFIEYNKQWKSFCAL